MKKLNWRAIVAGTVIVTLCDVAYTYYTIAKDMEDRAKFHENRADKRDKHYMAVTDKYNGLMRRYEATARERDTAARRGQRHGRVARADRLDCHRGWRGGGHARADYGEVVAAAA